MSKIADTIEEEIRRCATDYWPPDGAKCIGVEIDLMERDPCVMAGFGTHGFRVRKVERYPDHRYKKYGLSWKTGEWVLIPEGDGYPEETFLEAPPHADVGKTS
ncbi:MAG: hypothetical protein WC565_09725 [Parcubacteria group bacterium]